MSAKAINEASGKKLLREQLSPEEIGPNVNINFAVVTADTNYTKLAEEHPWLKTSKLVAKPDQLIKRRGKLGLLAVNVDYEGAQTWIQEHMGKEQAVGAAVGTLNRFIIEPFCAHVQTDEYYICIFASRDKDTILFTHEGGVDVGDVDAKALKVEISVGDALTESHVSSLFTSVPAARQPVLTKFVHTLYGVFKAQFFTYLEINPLVMLGDDKLYILDLAAKLDQTAHFM